MVKQKKALSVLKMATTIGRTITEQITVRTIDIRPANHTRNGSGRLKTPLQTSVQG